MPLVRIDTLGTDPARLDALGQAVQDALVQTPGIPPEDRFQVLTGHDGVTSTVLPRRPRHPRGDHLPPLDDRGGLPAPPPFSP